MSYCIYGIPRRFINDYLSKIDPEKQNHFLIEACADLIEAVSKHSRTHDDRDEIIDEMGHVLLSAAVVSHQLDITEKDVLDVVRKLGKKKDAILLLPTSPNTLERELNGITLKFPLSLQEQEDIYLSRSLVHLMSNAERHLRDIAYEDVADDENTEQVFVDTYRCTIDDMCNPASEHFALAYLANRFNDLADDDTAVNDTWDVIIREMLAQYKTGHMEADAIAAGASGACCCPELEADKFLIGLTREDADWDAHNTSGDNQHRRYICLNAPIDEAGWELFQEIIRKEESGLFANRIDKNALPEFAQHLLSLFIQTDYAKAAGINNGSVFMPNGRTPYWWTLVNFTDQTPPAEPEEPTTIVPGSVSLSATLPNGDTRTIGFTFDKDVDKNQRTAFVAMAQQILDETTFLDADAAEGIRYEIEAAASVYLTGCTGSPISNFFIKN